MLKRRRDIHTLSRYADKVAAKELKSPNDIKQIGKWSKHHRCEGARVYHSTVIKIINKNKYNGLAYLINE